MAGVDIRGIRKGFGQQPILRGIDLSIADGEFVVFVGPSGCGKSTLLRTICGLETADEGTVSIGGRDMTHVTPAARGIAMVFQSYALYPHMTVFDNMGFALKMAGLSRDEIRVKVEQAAATLRIEPLLQRKPKELSGGQRQRVAIGRAIVRQPQVFLFDEPLSNLDATLRVQMRIELARLHRSLASTMVYVTHDQVEAMTLADRIVVLRAGRIEQVGAPLALYHAPDNLFVAGFLGAPPMNFMAGEVRQWHAGLAVVALAGGAQLQVRIAAAMAPGTRVTLGMRPEHIVLGIPDGIAATVIAVERLGEGSYLYATVAGSGEALVVRADPDGDWSVGQRLAIGAPLARIHLFGENGRRCPP